MRLVERGSCRSQVQAPALALVDRLRAGRLSWKHSMERYLAASLTMEGWRGIANPLLFLGGITVERITVAVVGALGKMGQEVVRAVLGDEELELVAVVDIQGKGQEIGPIVGMDSKVKLEEDLGQMLMEKKPQVVVDFTRPQDVFANAKMCLEYGARPVVGTTGLDPEQIEELDELAKSKKLGGLIAPNFAIGAVLMMEFAKIAGKHFPSVEIIELHHEKKLDAPSGTAIKTAEMIVEGREGPGLAAKGELEKIQGVRGGEFEGIHIHSIRMPGFVAHQEVIFGLPGQTLTLRHDSNDRISFMPGVLLAIRKICATEGIVYGLEHFL